MKEQKRVNIHGGHRVSSDTNTPGVRFLSSIFFTRVKLYSFGKKLGEHPIFDIPAYYFYYRIYKNKEYPKSSDTYSIAGDFLWNNEIEEILNNFYLKAPNAKSTDAYRFFLDNVSSFRLLCVARFILSINESYQLYEEDVVTRDDVVNFTKILAGNNIWSDEHITNSLGLLYNYRSYGFVEIVRPFIKYINDTKKIVELFDGINERIEKAEEVRNQEADVELEEDTEDQEVGEVTIEGLANEKVPVISTDASELREALGGSMVQNDLLHGINFNDPLVSRLPEYELLEKEARKAQTHPDYHKYIDAADLTALKRGMVDPEGNEFVPMGWQARYLLEHSKFNIIVASRGCGKTYFSSYKIGRQLLIPNQKIAVLVPTKANHAKPIMGYLRGYFKRFKDVTIKDDYIRLDELNSEMTIYSGDKSNDSVRGAYANLLVVEEAAFLKENFVKNAMPLLMRGKANGMLYMITTVDPQTPKNRFYFRFLNAKQKMIMEGFDSDHYAVRIDLYNNPFMSEKDKKRAIEQGKRDPNWFNAEYMALFVGSGGLDISKSIVVEEGPIKCPIKHGFAPLIYPELLDSVDRVYNNIFICYDMAKSSDRSGVNVLGVRGGTIDVCMSQYLPKGLDFHDQVDVLIALKKFLKYKNAQYVIDYTGVGMAVGEIFERRVLQGGESSIYVNKVYSVGGIYEERDSGIWKVGKDLLKNKLKSLISLGKLKFFSFLDDLKIEFEAYDDSWKRSSSGHFDLIASLMIGVWFVDKMGFVYYEKEDRVKEHLEGEYDYMGPNTPSHLVGYEVEQDTYGYIDKFGY